MPLQQQYSPITSRAVVGMFFEQLNESKGLADLLAMKFTSDQSSENYAGLTNTPMLREWIGGKDAVRPKERSMIVTNKDFEATLLVSNKDLRRDKTDQLRIRIGQLAQRVPDHLDKLMSQLIVAGSTTTYGTFADGLSYFNSAHTYGSYTNNNTLSVTIASAPGGTGTHGTTTNPSASELAYAFLLSIQQLMGLVDSEGEPINQSGSKFAVMVPINMMAAAQQAVSVNMLAVGQTNPILSSGFTIQVIPNARLTAASAIFYMFRLDSVTKPFIYQVEVEPVLKALAEGSDFEFDNGAQKFSVEWAGNIGYGIADQAVKTTLV